MIVMKKHLGNKGSTLILVMVAIVFIGILGATVLTASAINNTMKEVDRKSKESFYTTDGIMEKIKAGLVLTSSDAAKIAYEKVLANYTTIVEDATISVQNVFNETYMKEIKKQFCSGNDSISGSFYYDVDKIEQLLSTTGEKTSYCKTDTKNLGENILEMHPEKRYMVFKNIMVKVQNGEYETKVKADIRLQTPDLSFSKGTAIYSEFAKYALIADNKLVVNPGITANVNGSIYSGIVKEKDTSNIGDTKAGIDIENGTLNLIGEYLISRGDILISNGGVLNIGNIQNAKKTNVWVENIRTSKSSGASKLFINGIINVSDDLEINGVNDVVTLSGEYYGYHYDKEYTDDYVTQTNAQYSSAIMINGKNATINMEQLSTLVLAGRTYLSKNGSDLEFQNQNKDIMLGESLSVRSNQVVYYVPSKYVTVSGETVILDIARYEDYVGFPVESYLSSQIMLTPYYLKNTNGTICYYYLNFKNEQSANSFYQDYFKYHPNVVKKNSSSYFSEAGITLNDSMILLLSGNLLYKDKATKQTSVKISNQTTPSSIMKMYANLKGREYKSRQLALIDNLQEAQGGDIRILDKTQNSLYKRLIQSDIIHNELNGRDKDPIWVNDLGYVFISDADTFVWDSTKKHLYGDKGIIICNGNVVCKDSFQGMVLSGGNVTFMSTGIVLNGDEYLIQNMFKADVENKFLPYLKVDITEETKNIEADFDYEGYVYYENWKKN